MVRLNRSFLTQEFRQNFARFQQNNQELVQQLNYIRRHFQQSLLLTEELLILKILIPQNQIQNFQNFRNQIVTNATATRNSTVYYSDPFQENIDPTSSDGAKLYLKAIAELKDDEKFEINITNAQKFLDQLEIDTENYG